MSAQTSRFVNVLSQIENKIRPLEDVGRGSETQLQECGKMNERDG